MPPPAVEAAGEDVVIDGKHTNKNIAIIEHVPGVNIPASNKNDLPDDAVPVYQKHTSNINNSASDESHKATPGTTYSSSKNVPKWVEKILGLASEVIFVLSVPNDGTSNACSRYLKYLYKEGYDVDGNTKGTSGVSNVMFNRMKAEEEDIEIHIRGFRRSPFEIVQQEMKECPKPVFWFGLGECVVDVEYKGLEMKAHNPRVLYLYASSNAILEELTRTMIHATQPPKSAPRSKGKFKLNTLEVKREEGIWQSHGIKNARLLQSVILPDGKLEAIVEDFEEFISAGTKAWFIEHGIPYRRSYLFHGPPGAGKTSCIRALAGNFDLPACFISLGNVLIGNKQLHDALRRIPTPAILVLEDIDALFNEKRRAETPTALTFSGLLNALDGLVSAEGIVTIMTTNHVERLDPALIRAGRVDRRFEFSAPDHAQVIKFFKSYYKTAGDELATEFANAVLRREEKEARCIATLQELFIFTRKHTARECVDMIPKFFAEFYPKSSQSSPSYYI